MATFAETMLAKYRYWKREVAREKSTRPQATSINLGGL
jgi:hypothetical protein